MLRLISVTEAPFILVYRAMSWLYVILKRTGGHR